MAHTHSNLIKSKLMRSLIPNDLSNKTTLPRLVRYTVLLTTRNHTDDAPPESRESATRRVRLQTPTLCRAYSQRRVMCKMCEAHQHAPEALARLRAASTTGALFGRRARYRCHNQRLHRRAWIVGLLLLHSRAHTVTLLLAHSATLLLTWKPGSTTYTMPSMVNDVSAMLVAST
jgi:hypothetical protein